MHINDLLKMAIDHGASDLHLKVGSHPVIRVDGTLHPMVDGKRLMQEDTIAMAFSIMDAKQKEKFKTNLDLDIAYSVPGLGRFRVNIFQQRGTVGIVARVIPIGIKTTRDLMLPAILDKIAQEQRGLILCTGTTGSGKSTTLAAMVDYANKNRRDHIITVEDPIEFVHESKNCLINHRETGIHTKSFASALRGALREDPDIILVGELRDLETIELALVAASTGHLVLGTLHTPSAAKTVDRMIDVFPSEQQNKIRATLSESLKGIVAQNLFKRIDKKGRVAALEILVFTTAIANLVREGKTHQIPGMIQVGKKLGNQPLDDAIMDHVRMKRISPEEAYDKCIDKKKFRTFLPHPPEEDEN